MYWVITIVQELSYLYVFFQKPNSDLIENFKTQLKVLNPTERILKPNLRTPQIVIKPVFDSGFFEPYSNHLKGSRKGLRPVPQIKQQ
jgi:hypothetical protein